jgi:hypothetical protein
VKFFRYLSFQPQLETDNLRNTRSFPLECQANTLKKKKIAKAYSLEYNNIPTALFNPHHAGRSPVHRGVLGHSSTNVLQGHRVLGHSCTNFTPHHCCATMICNEFRSCFIYVIQVPIVVQRSVLTTAAV